MAAPTADALRKKRCLPCEGDVKPMSRSEAEEYGKTVPAWSLADDGKSISRVWILKDFAEAIRFVNDVAQVAEEENHHPDIRLFSYRRVRLDLSTHAIHGLSENDFILAAKVDALHP